VRELSDRKSPQAALIDVIVVLGERRHARIYEIISKLLKVTYRFFLEHYGLSKCWYYAIRWMDLLGGFLGGEYFLKTEIDYHLTRILSVVEILLKRKPFSRRQIFFKVQVYCS